jgi:hypothetical protein
MEIDTASLPPFEKRKMTELEEKLLKAYQERHPEVKDRDTLVKVVYDSKYAGQNKMVTEPIRQKS